MNGSPIEFFVAFPLIWVTVVLVISRTGGWARLSRAYPARAQLGGRRFRFQSGRMRAGTRYGSCLNVGSDLSGLHLSILFLFRPGHRPFFVPWSEVSVHEVSRRGVELRVARVPDVPLILSKRLARQLADASAGSFAHPHITPRGDAADRLIGV